MKPDINTRCMAVAVVLIPLIALLGADLAHAKKPPKPPPPSWLWEVALPSCSTSNLCAEGQTTYADTGAEDGVWADVSKEGSRTGTRSRFGVAIFKCEPEEECYESSPDRVTLWGIELDEDWELGEGPDCGFPGTCGSDPSECLECFVNGRHPYWGDGQAAHEDDYRYFFFEVTMPGDFRNLDIGVGVRSSGELTMELWNTDEILVEGDEDHHAVYSHVDLPGDSTGSVTVTRQDENSWQMVVSVDGVDPRMRFVEGYVGCARPPNKKGNCPWEYKHPIWAWTAGPLTFETTWTRPPME